MILKSIVFCVASIAIISCGSLDEIAANIADKTATPTPMPTATQVVTVTPAPAFDASSFLGLWKTFSKSCENNIGGLELFENGTGYMQKYSEYGDRYSFYWRLTSPNKMEMKVGLEVVNVGIERSGNMLVITGKCRTEMIPKGNSI